MPLIAFLVLLLFTAPGPLRAENVHTWHAPTSVQADPSGYFEGEAVLTAGPGGSGLDWAMVLALENTDCCGWIADGYCEGRIEAGEQILVPFDGHLLDVHANGRIEVSLGACFGFDGYTESYVSEVEIRAHVVSGDVDSFGAIKALYRDPAAGR